MILQDVTVSKLQKGFRLFGWGPTKVVMLFKMKKHSAKNWNGDGKIAIGIRPIFCYTILDFPRV